MEIHNDMVKKTLRGVSPCDSPVKRFVGDFKPAEKNNFSKVSENDQEMLQSHIAHQPMGPWR